MSTLTETHLSSKRKIRRAYVSQTALAKSVAFNDDLMHVFLTDGRIISVPVIWFPLLHEATPEQRAQYEIGGGTSLLGRRSTKIYRWRGCLPVGIGRRPNFISL